MQLFYRTKGESTRPPLIILHGLWGASDNWLQVAELLGKHFYVILPDLRNHGRSPHHEILDYESMSQDIATFIENLQLQQKPYLVGHSMGGKTAMTLLLRTPNLIQQAAILDIAPITYPLSEASFHQTLIDFMTHFPISSYSEREAIHTDIRQAISSEMLCQILFKNIQKKEGIFSWKVNIRAIHKNMDKLLSFPTSLLIPCNTVAPLFIRGEKSEHITNDGKEAIARLFPTSQIKTIPDSGHFLHVEQPNLLAQTVLQFFVPSTEFHIDL